MKKLLKEIDGLKKTEIGKIVDSRLLEFKAVGNGTEEDIFKELCFCIMTANFTAVRGWEIQKAIDDGFMILSKIKLAAALKKHGHRFPNARAGYIFEARKHLGVLKKMLELSTDGIEARAWLAKNVKGLGFKESSHFLRNIGYGDVAIIDFHIVDILADNGLIERPKTITPRNYLEIEAVLKKMAGKSGLDMAELDLYLWYLETGKVLK